MRDIPATEDLPRYACIRRARLPTGRNRDGRFDPHRASRFNAICLNIPGPSGDGPSGMVTIASGLRDAWYCGDQECSPSRCASRERQIDYSPLPHIPRTPDCRCGGSGNGGICWVAGTSIPPRPAAITDIPGATYPTRMAPSAEIIVTLRV